MAESSVTLKLTAPQFRTLEETFDTTIEALKVRSTVSTVPLAERREARSRLDRIVSLRKDVFE